MRRARRREFVMNDSEAEDLTEKARRACMSESQLIRLLIKGYQPPPAPPEQFYEDMNRLLETCDRLVEAAKYVHKSEGKVDILDEVNELRETRRIFLRRYLAGKEMK